MISKVSYFNTLDIKPIKTYPDNSGRETTITSFDKVLSDQTDRISQKSTRKQEKTEKDSNGTEAAEDTGYKDPVTGKTVIYIDVAEKEDSTSKAEKESSTTKEDNSQVKKSSSASPQSTATSASSMKKTKYDAYFKEAAKKYDVSESLLKAIAKAESDFDPNCLSSAGAMGVMQLMPGTAEELGVDDPYDPEQNIMGGAKCISQKLKEFNGNVRLALAAYNAGSGAVRRNGGVPSYCNTYVNRVLSYKEAFETANAVG